MPQDEPRFINTDREREAAALCPRHLLKEPLRRGNVAPRAGHEFNSLPFFVRSLLWLRSVLAAGRTRSRRGVARIPTSSESGAILQFPFESISQPLNDHGLTAHNEAPIPEGMEGQT